MQPAMERLLINETIRSCAKMFEDAFRSYGYDIPKDLRDLKTDLATYNRTESYLSEYQDYLEEIANDYDNSVDPSKNLLVLMPDEFPNYVQKYRTRFPNINLEKELIYKNQVEGKNPGVKKKKFWRLITDTMHYEHDVRPIMIPIIEKLGIQTCVYCNVQYALTTNHYNGLFELDHRYPKSKYPFLCTSFYNLQPSCPSCNHGKKTATADFGLYTTDGNDLHPFHLLTTPQLYLRKRRLNLEKIQISLTATDTSNTDQVKLAVSHEHDFDINAIYRELRENAEETIWRCYAYDNTYKDLFLKKFPELYDKDALHRFVFGVHSDGNVHSRPLTKLVRDIEKDMRVIFAP